MASRGYLPPGYGGRSAQAPGMMRHGPFPSGNQTLETLPPELVENKIAIQEAEIERLAGDNHRLAATHVALRQDLVASQHDIQRLRAHIRTTQTETDIQIRVLLEKIGKMEVDIRASEGIKTELQKAHAETQDLVTARQELSAQIQQASEELERARADIKKIPEMHNELESMMQEHRKLRSTFEYEKCLNLAKVEQLKVTEKELLGMAREMEKLRAEVFNAERRAREPNPYDGSYTNHDCLYPPPHPIHGTAVFGDIYGRSMLVGVGASGDEASPYEVGNATANSNTGPGNINGSAGGAYDASHDWR